MKIKVDIDVSPEELRTFFGLPDVKPLQDDMLAQVRKQMHAGTEGYDPMTLLRPFLSAGGVPAMEALQRRFWESLGDPTGGREDTDGAAGKKR